MNTNYSLTINDWLSKSEKILKANKINSSRLDCLILLEFVLNKSRVHVLSETNQKLDNKDIIKLDKCIHLRKNHLPIAYITNSIDFFRRNFYINQNVLIPRPETEEIISQALKLNLSNVMNIADIGCGSGCIGITLALELPEKNVDLYDIDDQAIGVAVKNCSNHNLKLNTYKSDLLLNMKSDYDLIVCNLPYVPNNLDVSDEVKSEPKIAVFSGHDGMKLYRIFWRQINILNFKPKHIITESLISQHDLMNQLAINSGYKLVSINNLIQTFSLAA